MRTLVRRRAAREPLQHLTGSTAFSGLSLICRNTALIPRPETELLVEHATRLLQQLPPGLIIDVGTGTGAIPLALARHQPQHHYLGLDISAQALALAQENSAQISSAPPSGTQVNWQVNDLLEGQSIPAVLVTANLPYLTPEEIAQAEPEVRHDPLLALDGGPDGLQLIRRLLPQALSLTSILLLECGPTQTESVAALAQAAGFRRTLIHPDLTSRPRFVEAHRDP